MKKYSRLMTGLLAMASMGMAATIDQQYRGSGMPSIRRKTELTPKQKRLRLKAKMARIARRINR